MGPQHPLTVHGRVTAALGQPSPRHSPGPGHNKEISDTGRVPSPRSYWGAAAPPSPMAEWMRLWDNPSPQTFSCTLIYTVIFTFLNVPFKTKKLNIFLTLSLFVKAFQPLKTIRHKVIFQSLRTIKQVVLVSKTR